MKREPSFRPHVVHILHFLLTHLQQGPLRINLANELLRLPRPSFLFLYGYRVLDNSRSVIASVLTRPRFYKRFEYRVIDELCRTGTLPESAKPTSPDSLAEKYAKPSKCFTELNDGFVIALAANAEKRRIAAEAETAAQTENALDHNEPMSVAMSHLAHNPPNAAYFVAETEQGMVVTRYDPLPAGEERAKVVGAVTATISPAPIESASMELVPDVGDDNGAAGHSFSGPSSSEAKRRGQSLRGPICCSPSTR